MGRGQGEGLGWAGGRGQAEEPGGGGGRGQAEGPRWVLGRLRDQVGREQGRSLAIWLTPSHLQILVQLHFVPNHGHIQFILETT